VNCFPRQTWSKNKAGTNAASGVRGVGTLSVMSLSSRWVERSKAFVRGLGALLEGLLGDLCPRRGSIEL
jgi:hypothetical protein